MILDLFDREVVGWSIKPGIMADIAIEARTMAWFGRKPAPGLIHHADRGSQYASALFQDSFVEFGMNCSIGRKGNCWVNGPTERLFNGLKDKRVHGARYATHDAARAELFDYIETLCDRSRHFALGYQSPPQVM